MLSLLILLLLPAATAVGAGAPASAGGFRLKSNIDQYTFSGHENYLKEIIITDLAGFRKGFITYGTCERPGEILRIKLKYENRSYKFFEELLKKYREEFGSKPKFDGDQFGNVKAWKWSFTNEDNQRVTLELQHNLKDTEESIGNMLKLSLPDLMDEERRCFNRTYPENQNESATPGSEPDWGVLIPK
jgi:hypothetical protein